MKWYVKYYIDDVYPMDTPNADLPFGYETIECDHKPSRSLLQERIADMPNTGVDSPRDIRIGFCTEYEG